MNSNRFYFTSRDNVTRLWNRWDLLLFVCGCGLLFLLGWAAQHMATPYLLGEPLPISLEPQHLPFYALHTVLRMFIALFVSIVVSFILGAWAAKNRRAEQIIIPAMDVLQSVPVLSFLAITIAGFIHLFPGSLLGPECASIFVIFTAQVWNIAFSFYQSIKSVPDDLREVAAMFQLSAWQTFWKIEVPFSLTSLIWNVMIAMSASWFFVVLSEALVVAHQDIRLPGVGSYIALAIDQHDLAAVGYAILTMVVVILIYDQVLFRPLLAWSEKFKIDVMTHDEEYQSWLLDFLRVSQLMHYVYAGLTVLKDLCLNVSFLNKRRTLPRAEQEYAQQGRRAWVWRVVIWVCILSAVYGLCDYIFDTLLWTDVMHVMWLGMITGTRVMGLIVLSSVIWIPVGVWVGRRPHVAQKVQPIIQLVAAFPANLCYPLFVIAIVHYQLNVEIWLTPLMILGTQWYLLFNVIAGASMIPRDLCLVADNFGVKGLLWWRRLALPSIFPYYITGAITAAGGAWNASIVAEWVSWGSKTLHATGLGAYIQASTMSGDFPKIALGTAMMCVYVFFLNHVIWRPLYRLAQERF